MENKNTLSFHGKGSEYFGIVVVNWLLTALTLGIYYPWAKAKQLQYLYGASSLNGSPFQFNGTGKEMFKGFLVAVLYFIGMYAVLITLTIMEMPVLAIAMLYLMVLALIPFAIHGSYRYRMSRSNWKGIRFGYVGTYGRLSAKFYGGIFFTLITLGIYGPWMAMDLRKYILGHIRFGNLKFSYHGTGEKFFFLNIKGYFLTLLTLGIYVFWWQKDLFNYFVNNLRLSSEEEQIRFRSTAKGEDMFFLIMGNLFILIFTLGIGYAWTVTRELEFMARHIALDGEMDFNAILQEQEQYKNAVGEDVGEMLDMDIMI